MPTQSPSTSSAPSWTTQWPTEAPSISHAPSIHPSESPSTSSRPTVAPSESPSAEPSAPPTGQLYYPDWENVEQICVNDGATPEYMNKIQRDNYFVHLEGGVLPDPFLCMDNEHRLYTSNGQVCDTLVNLEQWDVKYTPAEWDTSDLFETLRDTILPGLIEPASCQDADILANALAGAMEAGLGGGDANVTEIGCATLSKNPDTSNPECGGCLEGLSFEGDWPDRPDGYYDSYNPSLPTTIKVEVSSICDAATCPDVASMTALYEQTWSKFENFVDTGSFQDELLRWANGANEQVPSIPELFAAQVVTDSLTTDGRFANPLADPETTVEVVLVTTTGTLSVAGLNDQANPMSAAEEVQAIAAFETAIADSLGANLPAGATVTVTGIENGAVSYEITLDGASSEFANAAVSNIQSSLDNAATLGAISASTGWTVDGNTAGATSQSVVAEVTITGQLTTTLTGLADAGERAEASGYFEDAIAATLKAEGALPDGASVAASIDSSGEVSYTVTMHLNPGADNAVVVSGINEQLEAASTQVAIANAVANEAVSGNSSIAALQTFQVTGFTALESAGVSFKLYADDCVASVAGPSADASAEKFYPLYGSGPEGGICLKKTVGEFASYEQERYDSLAECCEAKYSHNMQICCDAPDMGGCGSANTVYLPDYYSNVCLPRAEGALANFEKDYARESLSACCGDFFYWSAANSKCLNEST
ncbi:hypothetical protein ACHAXT_005109 [Thalassiosira profunda]